MMFIPGLQREKRVLTLLLIVYFMSLTWTVVSAVSSDTIKSSSNSTTPAPSATTISPTTSSPLTTPSLIPIHTPPASTAAPIKEITTPVPTAGGRKFDGASFVGGIILGIVITIIFILAFKWWQSRNKSYHSL